MKKFKETNFWKKLKSIRVNKAVYVTVITIMLTLAVIFAVTAAANRAKKPNSGIETESTQTETKGNTGTETKKQETVKETEKETTAEDVIGKLPAFELPASGTLGQKHSAEVQVFSNTMQDYRVHLGVDITTNEGAPVYAAADGVVSQIWDDEMMGKSVAVKHSGDCYTIYKNLSDTLAEGIEAGAQVRSGQLIGSVGESAMIEIAEEPHLHFEMTVGGLQVDPMDYLDGAQLTATSVDKNVEE